jgi:uncharacterized circularly permuted ATP-grasp superfamily protein
VQVADSMFRHYGNPGGYDEMFEAPGVPRPHYTQLFNLLNEISPAQFEPRRQVADMDFLRRGITFTVYSSDEGVEKIFPFDLIPRVVPLSEWRRIETGLQQRIHALNLFLHDIYHGQQILRDGVVPIDMVLGSPNFRWEMVGLDPTARYLHSHCRNRPDPRPRRLLPRPRRQPAHPLRRQLHAPQPHGHENHISGAVQRS